MDLRRHTGKASARVPAPRGHTWDEFVLLPDDDRRELIDGQYVETEVPTDLHEWIVMMLGHLLLEWALPRNAGGVFGSGYKVRVSPRAGVMPDIQFYRKGTTAGRETQGLVHGHPDLGVEIISPSSGKYDRVKKLGYYRTIGMPEYWLVDPEHRTLERLVLKDGEYSIAESLEGDDVFRPASFEGLEIPLASLWNMPA